MGKKEDDFLKEIQSKINKRSGGYYYSQQIKKFKRNLIFTTSVLVFVLILFLILRILSIRSAQRLEVSKKKSKNEKKKEKVEKKHKIIKPKFKPIKIEKESYKYLFDNIQPKDISFLQSLIKRYGSLLKDNKVILLVPKKEKEMLLKRFSERKFTIKKETYIQKGIYEQFIFDKSIFPKEQFLKKKTKDIK